MGQKHSRAVVKKEAKDWKLYDEKDTVSSTVDNKNDASVLENRRELAEQLRKDSAFLELVAWALERQFSVTIDDLCWLHHSRTKPGLSTTGILSIDDMSSFSAFKAAFLQKEVELRKMILEAEARENGGLITPILITEEEKGNQMMKESLDTMNL